ncbi:hypothetical protein SAMN06265361_10491 [Laceyella tengchongensis]|uniref:DUF7660 domain-containing protein n=1 Tax=Laceyella tengchongensis TaxID=574699 RepID=A0AA45WPR2_9BACL|nr:hypothetical protein [Laceyella tengchongensis]SMP22676.1 hypothetical protein SAMN06265361_10491 [Laceyella tengchongensis]
MDIQDMLEKIDSREDFIEFISYLIKDLKQNSSEWENTNLEDYLNGIASWVEDMDGIITEENFTKSIDWGFVATILYIGSRYE